MDDYIKRQDALMVCRNFYDWPAHAQIRVIPAADVAPVVHGRWIWNEDDECWVCSNCEASALNNYRGAST